MSACARLLARGMPPAEVARRVGVTRQSAFRQAARPEGNDPQLAPAARRELVRLLLHGALAAGFPTGLGGRPTRVCTRTPRGQSPVLQYDFSWKQLSALAGVSFWQFSFRLYPGAIKGPQLVAFLGALHRQVPGTGTTAAMKSSPGYAGLNKSPLLAVL